MAAKALAVAARPRRWTRALSTDPSRSAVDRDEVRKFGMMASRWWDPAGPVGPLHRMNPCRMRYVRRRMCEHFGLDALSGRPLVGLSVLDLGCGGGLAAESLARMGARVTAVDAAAENVEVARGHGVRDAAVRDSVEYRCATAEELLEEVDAGARPRFDAVLSLEVVEHVPQPADFVASMCRLTRPGGALVLSTINRTARSYLDAIVLGEHVLRMVEPGTHDWNRFVAPDELQRWLVDGVRTKHVAGLRLEPLSGSWTIDDDKTDVNYILFAVRDRDAGKFGDNDDAYGNSNESAFVPGPPSRQQ